MLCLLVPSSVSEAKKPSNYQIVETLAKKTHRPIKLVNYGSDATTRVILNRKNKKYLVVERVISISNGRGAGWTSEGTYIAYNKKVARNKRVISYIIYSPKTNYSDDVLWVVDNHTYR